MNIKKIAKYILLIVLGTLLFPSRVEAGNGTEVTLDPAGVYTPDATEAEQKIDYGTYLIKINTEVSGNKMNGVRNMYCLVTVKRKDLTAITYDITDIDKAVFKRLNYKNYSKSRDYETRYAWLNQRIERYNKVLEYKDVAPGNTEKTPWYMYEVSKPQADYLFLIHAVSSAQDDYALADYPTEVDYEFLGGKMYAYSYNCNYNEVDNDDKADIRPFDSYTMTPTTTTLGSEGRYKKEKFEGTVTSSGSSAGLTVTTNPCSAVLTHKIASTININKSVKVSLKYNFKFTGKMSISTQEKGNCAHVIDVPGGTYTNLYGITYKNITVGICRNVNNHMNVSTYSDVYDREKCLNDFNDITRCGGCGKVFSIVKRTKLGHNYGNWEVTKEATCTTDGTKRRFCQRCGVIEIVTINKLGHNDDNKFVVSKPATCTESGLEKTHCTRCKIEMSSRVINALGHLYNSGKVTKAATCTEKGVMTYSCTRCNSQKTADIAPLGHSWDNGKITKAPTETSTGIKTFTCKTCKVTRTEVVAKTSSEQKNPDKKNDQKTTEQQTTTQPNTSSDNTANDDKDYKDSSKVSNSELAKNLKVTDKKSGGKYRITSIKFKNGKAVGGSVTYVRPNNKNCTKMTAPKNIKIGGVKFKVTSISERAFKGCKNLKSVTIESNVITIGRSAFYGCSKLRTVNIRSKKIRGIGKNSFKGISSKATVKVPKGKLKGYKKKLLKAGLSKKATVKN